MWLSFSAKKLSKMEYDFMAQIEKVRIPYILIKGFLCYAEAGSGKIIAFLFPIVFLLLKNGQP